MNDRRRDRRNFLILALLPVLLVLPWAASWAQNENETVGFQSNHLFAEGQFGENIDILNGGLNLTIPIGQRYQVTQNLGYQLNLTYTSKVWRAGFLNGMAPIRQGNVGLGFSLNFGRIYRDVVQIDSSGANSAECKWYYVSADGNEHPFQDDAPLISCDSFPGADNVALDGSFSVIGKTGSMDTWNGDPSTAPQLSITTPDGSIYEFAHLVQVYDASNNPLESNAPFTGMTDELTRLNRDFGGWYVTKIRSTKSSQANFVQVTYDSHSGFEHVIAGITDSFGRNITFNNSCTPTATCGSLAQRSNVRTTSVVLPAFMGSTATYAFTYDYATVENPFGSEPLTFDHVNLLRRLDYPQQYSTSFTYTSAPGGTTAQGGEILLRTLPTCVSGGDCATVHYTWSNYQYMTTQANSAKPASVGTTREITEKRLRLLPSDEPTIPADSHGAIWTYIRDYNAGGTYYSNPSTVIVEDPMGNDAQYYYRFSSNPPAGVIPKQEADDSLAPEWNDGVNWLVEYYQGHGINRTLLRTQSTEYDSDREFSTAKHLKRNVRATRNVTTFIDGSSATTTRSYSDWENHGHWKTTVESGEGISGTRTTRREYFDFDPSQFTYEEITDGKQVLSRTENDYSGAFLVLSVQKAVPPASIHLATQLGGTSASVPAGDVVTLYKYDPTNNGNVVEKYIGDHGTNVTDPVATKQDGLWSMPAPTSRIRYTWQAGGYLATKEFYDNESNGYFSWKAIDRGRDGNTGLIYQSRDPASILTTYSYDVLGRLTDISPTYPELSTHIEYRDALHTSVRQGDSSITDVDCSGTTGDYVMSCYEYDTLGRLIKTTKRPFDPSSAPGHGFPYKRIEYNGVGWKTAETEWARSVDDEVETTYWYAGSEPSAPIDPFGRVRRVMTPTEDASGNVIYEETDTNYSGLSSEVKVLGIAGPNGNKFDATTTYERDPWGRLMAVHAPQPGTDEIGAYFYGGGDAFYTYDLRNNLIGVEIVDSTTGVSQSRAFEYDAIGRLRNSFSPESGSQSVVGYDALGNVTDTVDAAGTHQLLTYDGAGRLSEVQKQDYLAPGSSIIRLLHNTYDQTTGKLTTSEDFDDFGDTVDTLERHYDSSTGLNGRLTQEVHTYAGWFGGGSVTTAYTYNNFGLLDTLVYPEGQTGKNAYFRLAYGYSNGYPVACWDWGKDASGNDLTRPTDPALAQASLTYNAAGGIQDTFTAGGMRDWTEPEVSSRPKQITIGKWDGSGFTRTDYQSGQYLYDGAGDIASIGTNSYGYDAANRLVQAIDTFGPMRTETFSYDDFGNMTEKDLVVSGGGSQTDMYVVRNQSTGSTTNRVISHQVGGATSIFTYDARGNIVQGDGYSYQPDSRNRVQGIRTVTGSTQGDLARYSYDFASNRVRKEDFRADLFTFYARDVQGRLLTEFRKSRSNNYAPEWAKHYLYLGDRLIGMRENQIPTPPGRLTATIDRIHHKIFLAWMAPAANEGVSVTGYRVYRSDPNTASQYWSTSALTFEDGYQIANNVWYSYIVTPLDSGGHEGYGVGALVIMGGDILSPNSPSGLNGIVGDGRVDLTWSQNQSSEGVIGYHVYRALGTGSPVKISQTPVVSKKYVSPNTYAMSFTDQGLVNGSTYRYSVSAVDSASNESPRSTEISLIPTDLTPPDPPRHVRTVSDCSSPTITVSWDTGPSREPVIYTVFRTPQWGEGPSVVADGNSLVDPLTTPGVAYTYYVKARDNNNNMSVPSLSSSITARASSAQVARPKAPFTKSGDGKVTLYVIRDPNTVSTRIYRKPNVDVDCSDFELIGDVASQGDWDDGAVQNGVAYDYAFTNVDSQGNESGLSPVGLGLPVAKPQAVSLCIEELPGWADGAIQCVHGPQDNQTPWRRLVIRWASLPSTLYQPYTPAAGTLGYLKGYRAYELKLPTGSYDQNSLTPLHDDYKKGVCSNAPDVVCSGGCFQGTGYGCGPGSAMCPSGGSCQAPHDGSVSDGYGDCWPNWAACMEDSDCQAGSTCTNVPVDPALLRNADGVYNYPLYLQTGYSCIGLKAVYKIFVNGTWRTVESDYNDNFSLYDAADPMTRCAIQTVDVCNANLVPPSPWMCPQQSTLPPTPTIAPTTYSSAAGVISVTWTPLSTKGTCELASPPDCYTTPCPTSGPAEYCSEGDNWKCRISSPTACSTTADCPSPPAEKCVINTDQIASYRLYASERTSEQFHFVYPRPSLMSFPMKTHSYSFAGLSDKLWAHPDQSTAFSFRVATVDRQGRISRPSPPSATITPMAAADPKPPASLRQVIWTLNDSEVDYQGGAGGFANPRNVDGIKIAWRDGYNRASSINPPVISGYRVWRLTPQGTWCGLLKPGSAEHPNPPGVSLCTNDVAGGTGDFNALSETLTTGGVSSNRVYVDTTAAAGASYTYAVSVVDLSGNESPRGQSIQAMALPHAAEGISPPAYFKAEAPPYPSFGPGIYLTWCPNPASEGISSYRVYRSKGAKNQEGPFGDLLATIPAACLDQGKQCVIAQIGQTVTPTSSCTPGLFGDCKVIDNTLISTDYPALGTDSQLLIDSYTYNYVITAVRDTGSGTFIESGYSIMNRGYPSFHSGSAYQQRFDPDPVQDTPCGDEDAQLLGPRSESAETGGVLAELSIADYRIVGATTAGTPGTPPSPGGLVRFLYFHADHLGSPRVITDLSGNIISTHHYMPFGEEMPFVTQGSTNKRQFTGHERDPETGLDYMLARFYSSGLARFTAVDPGDDTALGEPQSWNHYTYVGNNPIGRVDPSGMHSAELGGFVWSTDPIINHVNASNDPTGTEWPGGTWPAMIGQAAACHGMVLCDGGGEGGGGGSEGANPPPPPGYDPSKWEHGKWDNGKDFLKDPDGATWTAHPEDKGHWRHWDKQGPNGEDQGRWPKNSLKPRPNQRKPRGDQSLTDPSGDTPGYKMRMTRNPLGLFAFPLDFGFGLPMFVPGPILIPAIP
jgi:RHS repeat-associated protein